tara:strand:- start:494329 stop:494484 length:156 start_codon:yes stop_codon:yes gene_type:complete
MRAGAAQEGWWVLGVGMRTEMVVGVGLCTDLIVLVHEHAKSEDAAYMPPTD